MPVRDRGRSLSRHHFPSAPLKKRQLTRPKINIRILLSLIISIPLFSLFVPHLFYNSTQILTIQQSPNGTAHPHPQKTDLSHARLEQENVPEYERAPSPSLSEYVPRKSQYSLTASREEQPPDNSRPNLHAIFICQTPCCTETLFWSIRSLIRQTFIPTHLTYLHACADHARTDIRHQVRRALAAPANLSTSYTLRPEASDHLCPTDVEYVDCVLKYLAEAAEADDTGFAFLTSEAVILEPTALEKLWLSLSHRPKLAAVRLMAYDPDSLADAMDKKDPLMILRERPFANHSLAESVTPIPLFYSIPEYRKAISESFQTKTTYSEWAPLVDTVSRSRLLRDAVYTRISDGDVLSFSRFEAAPYVLPAHLFSELAYYKWSARNEELETYENPLYSPFSNDEAQLDISAISHWPLGEQKEPHRVFLVMPWMQMGGSEKCMLDIAERVLEMGWGLTFVLTMPFWQEDVVGEIALTHQWLDRALELTSDVFDLLSLAPHETSSRIFRYLLESRKPDFLLMANSRWAYAHSEFIKAVSPQTVVADYNHMIHMSWEGGGMPRYGANNSQHFDLHLTASENVASAMKKWIDPEIMREDNEKVIPCYIGTDPNALYSGAKKVEARNRMREELDIPAATKLVLFAGRFLVDKGIDVVGNIVLQVSRDEMLAKRLSFLFVGSGDEENMLRRLPLKRPDGKPLTILRPPALGLEQLKDYYAASDIFLLPSVNEGIALVAYEAMAAGVLVMTTDVGGQSELISDETGVLLTNYRSLSRMTNYTFEKLKDVLSRPEDFGQTVAAGRELVRTEYTTKKFQTCVVENMLRVQDERKKVAEGPVSKEEKLGNLKGILAMGVGIERYHGMWNRNAAVRPVENLVTIGIKTYVCDGSILNQLQVLVRSIRVHYPKIRVLVANDGPESVADEDFIRNDPFTEEHKLLRDSGISYGRNYMVNQTSTRYFVLLDDDHVFDDTTNLTALVNGIRKYNFDLVGMRVRNLPGIDELERTGIVIPRYVAEIRKLEDRELTLCVWNENKGPSIFGITHPIKVDVLHNAFIGSVDVLRKHKWRNELKVNEHMTFFLDAKDAHLKVGYLPSVFVHHRSRDYSDCYYKVRFREDEYRNLLRYKDQFLWDLKCQEEFPERVRDHIIKYELDA